MGKSQRVTLRDIERLMLLQGDLHHQEALSEEWKTHLLDGVNRLVPVRLAIFTVMKGFCEGARPEAIDGAALGELSDDAAQGLGEWFARPDIAATHPLFAEMMRIRRPLFTHRRVELVEDDDWRRSEVVTKYFNLLDVEDNLCSICRVVGGGRIHGIGLHREIEDEPFTRRDRALIHLLQRGLQATYENYERRRVEREMLTPRMRQVLALLMQGLTESETAQRLGISPHTCHDHVKRLHAHFGVSNRAELVAAGRRLHGEDVDEAAD